MLAGLKRKWFLLQCAEHKIAKTLGHALILSSGLDPLPRATQTRHKCICYLADMAKIALAPGVR